MRSVAGWSAVLSDSLIVDEVGIETASVGNYRLRCFYEPVFERRGRLLHRVAVQGAVMPFLSGQMVSDADMLANPASRDRCEVELLRVLLQLCNYRNIGAPGPELHIDLAPLMQIHHSLLSHAGTLLASHIQDVEIDPRLVVCSLASSDAAAWSALASGLREHGVGIAIGDFGAGDNSMERFDEICPDLVCVDETWFAKVCKHDATIRLFGAAVRQLQNRNIRVLASGIGSRESFGIALRSGVDLFRGPLLAGLVLAGTDYDETPLGVAELLGAASGTEPAFG